MCSILIVDDNAAIRAVFSRWARALGHEVREAWTTDAALGLVADQAADVVVCDVNLQAPDSPWLPFRLREASAETAVIVATARTDASLSLACLRQGIVDFVSKPVTEDRFREALARGVAWHRDAVNARRRLAMLQQEMRDHLENVEQLLEVTPLASDADLERLLESVSANRLAVEHGRRVAALAGNIALAIGIREPELSDIRRAAMVHDLGRVALPATILCKTTRLSEEELAVVREQPVLVSRLMERHPFLATSAPIVGAIFERIDGSGHPRALRGDEIPRGARVIAVADALDTMTHYRIYKDQCSMAEAVFEVRRGRGTQFDPAVVDAFESIIHLHWAAASRRATADERSLIVAAPPAGEPLAGTEADEPSVDHEGGSRPLPRLRRWLGALRSAS